jgi:hypothetical protein
LLSVCTSGISELTNDYCAHLMRAPGFHDIRPPRFIEGRTKLPRRTSRRRDSPASAALAEPQSRPSATILAIVEVVLQLAVPI